MKTFANLFLILYFADGSISLLDELASLLVPNAPLALFRGGLAETVLLFALALYLLLGIDRRLPKRLFLPLILYVCLCPLSVWLFPALAGSHLYSLLLAAGQIALGTVLLPRFRERGDQFGLTLPPEQFQGPGFSWRNTLVFAALNIVLFPFTLGIPALYLADSYAARATGGFMRVEPRGLYMQERVYRRGDRTVRLAAMIHVGEKEYYRDVARLPAGGRTVVLAEGVTDEKGVLRNRFDYRKVASFLGLDSQEKMLFSGRVIDAKALDAGPSPGGRGGKTGEGVEILRADVDLASFRPETLLFLNQVGKELKENPSLVQAALKLDKWGDKNITPQMYEVIMDDILHRRNKVVLGYLDRALARYDTVVVPWGALHMKEIEAGVLERGFVLQEERKMLSIDLTRLLSG